VSAKDPEKKDLDKRIRFLTILTAKMEILACRATFFDSTHPLPEVCVLQPEIFYFSATSLYYMLLTFCLLNPLQGHQFLTSRPPLPKEGPLTLNLPLLNLKPPRLVIIKMGMKSKVLWCHLLLLNLRLKLQRRSGSAWKT
jgi:hypothetical protein